MLTKKQAKDLSNPFREDSDSYEEWHNNFVDEICEFYETQTCSNCYIYSDSEECYVKQFNMLDASVFRCEKWRPYEL